MSLSTEQYNRLRGPGLTVLVIDKVRQMHQHGAQLSTRQLARTLAADAQLKGPEQFAQLYQRVRIVVRGLADAGMVQLHTTYHSTYRVNLTLITPATPCSASTAK